MGHRRAQTVRQVRGALGGRRALAYTVMTVLHRLAGNNLVIHIRDDRAYRYAPTHGRAELVARLMVDALDQVAESDGRQSALVSFVERVGADETDALGRALAEVGSRRRGDGDHCRHTRCRGPGPAAPQQFPSGIRRPCGPLDTEGLSCPAS